MITLEHARLMARYNRWMNEKLYAAAAQLSDAQRAEDRGAFFKSVQGTCNHLLFTDRIWLNRFTSRSIEGLDPAPARFADFGVARGERAALDDEIAAWAETVTPAWLAASFRYYSVAYGGHFEKPAWLLVTHWFNHQTHHRGQLTTMLSQFGVDPGVTDLPMLPGT